MTHHSSSLTYWVFKFEDSSLTRRPWWRAVRPCPVSLALRIRPLLTLCSTLMEPCWVFIYLIVLPVNITQEITDWKGYSGFSFGWKRDKRTVYFIFSFVLKSGEWWLNIQLFSPQFVSYRKSAVLLTHKYTWTHDIEYNKNIKDQKSVVVTCYYTDKQMLASRFDK